jgi:hypothetical protein
MADISDKLLAQFVVNLNTLIAADDSAPAAAPAEAAEAAATTQVDDVAVETAAVATDSGVRKIDGPEAEALDLLSISRGVIIKRALPVVAVIAAVVIWLLVK